MKAVVFTLGCKVNACESASLMNGLKELGYEVTDELSPADLYIVNTCAVTAEAEKKSRQAIARARKFNPRCEIVVTGCASQKSPEDFLKKNNVTLVTGAQSKDKILSMIGKKGVVLDSDDGYYEEFLPAKTGGTRAYVKVQDGCDNFCSYCVIPYLRGRSRSRRPENILKEIEYLSPKEVVITGINLSAYDKGGEGLTGLVRRLSSVECRIRLGSLEVNVIDDEFLCALKGLPDFAPHFHLSLQSGSDGVLKAMNRRYTAEEFLKKCGLIRSYFPDAGITTDIIVGYSAETEEDFLRTLETARKARFSDIHCFPYSRREGTVGAKLKELPHEVKEERMSRMLALKAELKDAFLRERRGKTEDFLAEEEENGFSVGYTGNYLRCYVKGVPVGEKVPVVVGERYADGAFAEVLK